MDQLPDSTVDNEGDERVRVAPKLFLKALPGGTFTSSSSSSHRPSVQSPPPPIIKRVVPSNSQGKPKTLAQQQQRSGEGIQVQRITHSEDGGVGGGGDEGAGKTSPGYLPNSRFLSGTRNFLKPRKRLPDLTPIGTLQPSTSTAAILQARAGSTGTSVTIVKTPIGEGSPKSKATLQTQGKETPPAPIPLQKVISVSPGAKPNSSIIIRTNSVPVEGGGDTKESSVLLLPKTPATMQPPVRAVIRGASPGMQKRFSIVRNTPVAPSNIVPGSGLQMMPRRNPGVGGQIRPGRPRASLLTPRMSVAAATVETKIKQGFENAAMSVSLETPSDEGGSDSGVSGTAASPASSHFVEGKHGFSSSPLLIKHLIASKNAKAKVRDDDDDDDDTSMSCDEPESPTAASATAAAELESKDEDGDGNTRRTGRRRKPTKPFITDFSPATRRRRGEVVTNVDTLTTEGSFEPGPESIPSSPDLFFKVRGRPRGSGRGRGRPRGSTMKAKLERERLLLDSVNSEGGDVSLAEGDPVESDSSTSTRSPIKMETESCSPKKGGGEMETPKSGDSGTMCSPLSSGAVGGRGGRGRGRGSPRGTPFTPRGSRRGRGSRGGRGSVAARKLLIAKRKEARLAKLASTPQVFDEEACMSSDVKPTEKVLNGTGPPSTPVPTIGDEEASNMSLSSASASKNKKFSKDFVDDRKPVTAETLFEYQWPQDNPDADFYFLQEQIIEYLGHKSFRRKYPNLRRRCIEMEERDFVREQKIVSETQCDLGLTAVNSTEVLDILYSDFPDKYEEYRKIEVERKEKELTRSQPAQANNNSTRDRSAEFIKRITKACASWNSTFNRDRKENRAYCYDLQTCTINVPSGAVKALPPEQTKLGYHPVPVIHGQYTDGYQKYTQYELKYLPLNSVMYGPIHENRIADESGESDSDSEGSSSSDNMSGSSSNEEETEEDEGNINVFDIISAEDSQELQGKTCKSCNGDHLKNKDGRPEILINCAKCEAYNHPSCLELSLDMVPYIRKYNWQCTDCKNCIECNDPADEDKMLFCDCCDRGYHIYCVGLRKVPNGRWHCLSCSVCYSCGATEPAPEEKAAEWHHEYKKGPKNAKYYMHSLCVSCHKTYKKGQYCPACHKVHITLEDKNLLECRSCEKWVHKQCVKRPLQPKFGFVCDQCDHASFAARTKLPGACS